MLSTVKYIRFIIVNVVEVQSSHVNREFQIFKIIKGFTMRDNAPSFLL